MNRLIASVAAAAAASPLIQFLNSYIQIFELTKETRGRKIFQMYSSSNLQTLQVPLWQAAHGRTGDKGNRSNISVIAWHEELWPVLVSQVTPERVQSLFDHRNPSGVRRYLLPGLGAMNFVIDDVLDGGVNGSLNLDSHGKTLAFLLLDMLIEVPAGLARYLKSRQPTEPRAA